MTDANELFALQAREVASVDLLDELVRDFDLGC